MLKNITNHSASKWGEKQMKAAIEQFSGVEDLGFPNVPPHASSLEVEAMADRDELREEGVESRFTNIRVGKFFD